MLHPPYHECRRFYYRSSRRQSLRRAPPQLRVARLEDWEQIHRLEKAHFPAAHGFDDWSRLWLENPLWPRLGDRWPMGWLLEDRDGRVVGSLLNIPTLCHFQGRELINAVGRGWAVDRAYRGYALWLLDEYYSQPGADLFVNNTIIRRRRVPIAAMPRGSRWESGTRFPSGSPAIAASPGRFCKSWACRCPACSCACRRVSGVARLPSGAIACRRAASGFSDRDSVAIRCPVRFLLARTPPAESRHAAGGTGRADARLALRGSATRRGRLWVYVATRNGQLRAIAC